MCSGHNLRRWHWLLHANARIRGCQLPQVLDIGRISGDQIHVQSKAPIQEPQHADGLLDAARGVRHPVVHHAYGLGMSAHYGLKLHIFWSIGDHKRLDAGIPLVCLRNPLAYGDHGCDAWNEPSTQQGGVRVAKQSPGKAVLKAPRKVLMCIKDNGPSLCEPQCQRQRLQIVGNDHVKASLLEDRDRRAAIAQAPETFIWLACETQADRQRLANQGSWERTHRDKVHAGHLRRCPADGRHLVLLCHKPDLPIYPLVLGQVGV